MKRLKCTVGAVVVALVSGVVFWIGCLLFLALPVRARQDAASVPVNSAPDNFVGEWKFNPEKSSPGTQRASLKIELQGTDYKFTNDKLFDNGTELQWWFVTDMKGDCVKSTQLNGKPMGGETCMTRIDSNTFVRNDKLVTESYKVDPKKRTMTVEFAPKSTVIVNGRHASKTKSVNDRVSVEK